MPRQTAETKAKMYQTSIRTDEGVRARIRAVCYHDDISKQAFLIRAVLRALDEAEQRLGLTRKPRAAK